MIDPCPYATGTGHCNRNQFICMSGPACLDQAPDGVEFEEDFELGDCPYFALHYRLPGYDPDAICGYGCRDEPECVTCEPLEGWSNAPAGEP